MVDSTSESNDIAPLGTLTANDQNSGQHHQLTRDEIISNINRAIGPSCIPVSARIMAREIKMFGPNKKDGD